MSYVCVSGVTFGSALIMALIVESPLTKLGRYLEHAIKPRERCAAAAAVFADSPVDKSSGGLLLLLVCGFC